MLTDKACKAAKAGPKVQKLSDGGGLQLWIMPNGSKLWRHAYRIDGKQRVSALGNYGDGTMSLVQAREALKASKAALLSGQDPVQAKAAARRQEAVELADTFDTIAAELVAKKRKDGRSASTIAKTEWLLTLVTPLTGRPIREITAAEVLEAIRPIEAKGNIETAHRLRALVGETFRFAIATARAESDPSSALRGALLAPKVTPRAAIIEPKDFGALLRSIEGYDGEPVVTAALRLMAYLYPRPGELCLAEWSEFDLDAALWKIPAGRMKMRREHVVPLPKQAVAILRSLRDLPTFSASQGLVFRGLRDGRAISENTMNAALRRMGYRTDQMTAHGFRAAASTMLNEGGKFSADAIERSLAHSEKDEVRGAYNRGAYLAERVAMAQFWADRCDAMRDGAEVVPLRRGV